MIDCLVCNKRIPKGRRKYCSEECLLRVRYTGDYKIKQKNNSKKYYYEQRDNDNYRKKRTLNMRRWYEKNKEKQKQNIKRNYHNNKNKWSMRDFAVRNRKVLIKYIKPRCYVCKKNKIKIISTIKYDKELIPCLKGYSRKEQEKALKNYAIKNLKGLCSNNCKGKAQWGKGYEQIL